MVEEVSLPFKASHKSGGSYGMAASDYLRLVKFRYHISFVTVAIGALLFAGKLTPSLLECLVLLYASFNGLLYTGIYTINDIADVASDQKHPLKRERPLPSQRISRRSAIGFASTVIVFGFLSAFILFGWLFVGIYAAFLALNLAYSFAFKNTPYWEFLVNAATHPLRFLMGIALVSARIPYPLLLAIFFFAFGMVVTRRKVETEGEDWEARTGLTRYSSRALFFLRLLPLLLIAVLSVADASVPRVIYMIMIPIYALLSFGFDYLNWLRSFYRMLWTN